MEEPIHDEYVCLIAAVVKSLCKNHIKHFSSLGFLNSFDKVSRHELNDSFNVEM